MGTCFIGVDHVNGDIQNSRCYLELSKSTIQSTFDISKTDISKYPVVLKITIHIDTLPIFYFQLLSSQTTDISK